MRLIFVRHCEPDYDNDTLTEKGFLEAKAVADFYKDMHVDEIYTSPLPRAFLTCEAFASYHKDTTVEVIEELREFNQDEARLPDLPKRNGRNHVSWDFLPRMMCEEKVLYDYNSYFDSKWFNGSKAKELYDASIAQLDRILLKHGYRYNEKGYFDVLKESKETIVIFSHLGKISVLLSHLLKIPHVVLAQHFCLLTSSVTVVVTEEREQGIAQFRCLKMGDTSHLAAVNLDESFKARWAEVYSDPERH